MGKNSPVRRPPLQISMAQRGAAVLLLALMGTPCARGCGHSSTNFALGYGFLGGSKSLSGSRALLFASSSWASEDAKMRRVLERAGYQVVSCITIYTRFL